MKQKINPLSALQAPSLTSQFFGYEQLFILFFMVLLITNINFFQYQQLLISIFAVRTVTNIQKQGMG